METSKIKVVMRSLLISYLLSALLMVVVSFVLYKFRLKESQMKMAVNLIYILSCAMGGFLMGKGFRQRRFFWGLLFGLLYFAVLFVVSMLLQKSIGSTTTQLFITMGMCVGSGVIGGILS